MKRFRMGVLVGVAAAAFTVVGCSSTSGDDDDPTRDPNGDATRSTTSATASPRTSESSTPDPSPSSSASPRASATAGSGSGSGATSEGRNALIESLNKLDRANYHVVYRIESSEDGQPFTGTFALAAKGEKNLFVMEMDSVDGPFVLATVDDGEKSYFCLGGEDPDNPGEIDASCFEGDDDGPLASDDFPFLNFEEEIQRMAADGEAEVTAAPDRRVGLRDAKCWEITDDSGTGVACVSKADGFLVLVDGEFDGSRVYMEVESYTDNPDDSAFVPPYPVESLSDDNG